MTAPTRVICVAKPARTVKARDACNVELHPVELGIPGSPSYGHVARIRWPHWAVPKVVTA